MDRLLKKEIKNIGKAMLYNYEADADIDISAMQLLNEMSSSGFIKFSDYNKIKTIVFEIEGLTPIFESGILKNRKNVLSIMKDLRRMLIDLEDSFIEQDHILFNEETVFVDDESGRLKLAVLPCPRAEDDEDDLETFTAALYRNISSSGIYSSDELSRISSLMGNGITGIDGVESVISFMGSLQAEDIMPELNETAGIDEEDISATEGISEGFSDGISAAGGSSEELSDGSSDGVVEDTAEDDADEISGDIPEDEWHDIADLASGDAGYKDAAANSEAEHIDISANANAANNNASAGDEEDYYDTYDEESTSAGFSGTNGQAGAGYDPDLKIRLKDELRDELREEFRISLKDELRMELEDEIRENVEAELMAEEEKKKDILNAYLIRRRTGEVFYLDKEILVIGSNPVICDYAVMNNPAISRIHAIIRYADNGDCMIADANSTNHIFINGKMISSADYAFLEDLTHIHIANEEFIFHR